MGENKNIPQIRFIGFSGTWEERKLDDISDDKYGGGTPKTSVESYWNGSIPWIQSSDLTEDELSNVYPRKFISEAGLRHSATKLVPQNSIAIITRVGVGKLAYMPFSYTTSQDYLSLSKLNIDAWFSVYSIYKKIKGELNAVQGTSIKGITKDELLSKCILIPNNPKEQSKIGTYFQNLDKLITLQQQKHDKLVTLKKAMLDKMFPKEGADVPEIRFKGFTEAWKEGNLGDLSESFEYGLNAPATPYDGTNKYLRITDIDDVSHNFNKNDLTTPKTNLNLAGKFKLSSNDILFARTGASVGKSYIYKESDGLVYFAGFLIRAIIKSEINAGFVFQNTLTERYIKFIRITSQRSGQPGVNAIEYSRYRFMIPTKKEQDKIDIFLSKLDKLISLHQQEIQKLKNMKKACLEKMFV